MNAAAWAGSDWLQMIDHDTVAHNERKLRLWAVAVGRLLLKALAHSERPDNVSCSHVPAARLDQVLEMAERYADGAINRRLLRDARYELDSPDSFFHITASLHICKVGNLRFRLSELIRNSPRAVHAAVTNGLRDIFGNPFRPVAFAPEWRTSTAIALADAMYAARDFANLPVLADVLEEAGCDNPDVLAHCRGPGPHVRGCWVVDHVLGKT